MKVLHVADWHLGSPRSPFENGVNLRSQDTLQCLEEMLRVAGEEKPDYTLVCGDIFDKAETRQGRSHREVLQARHMIMGLSKVSGQVVVMRGTPNHDSAEAFEELQAHFEGTPNVHIMTSPQVLSFGDADIAVLPGFDKGIYRASCPGLSGEQENEAFTQEISNIILGMRAQCRQDKKSILMAHYTVPGCNMVSSQTVMLERFEPVIAREALLAADYDLVALGHIHRPQKIQGIEECFYSGAVNAMDFSDENQERGFWVHTDMPSGGWDSRFYKTPYREFITLHFTDADVEAVNAGGIDEVACNYWRYNGAVRDKMVRIHYSCPADSDKAYRMNRALVERTLLEDGAFMLWENIPEKVKEYSNETVLVNTADPEENLIKYLEEKQFPPDKVQKLALKARPVIAEAVAGMPAAANTGIFEPVEISVKDYRNYKDETFNFENVSFCTINGQNGAGKSSLFMDAIVDCLYEQPREGVIKDNKKSPWIRNDEKVRSGSIVFTFRIGGKTYRVARSRERSGGGKLNIARLVDSVWENCSKGRMDDTQKEIVNIIGMDCFTFKSCALIMQDQYGIFLQAKPEERMEVLGTLLGLGVYQSMEKLAHEKRGIYDAKAREMEQEIKIRSNTLLSLGTPDAELGACKEALSGYESSLRVKTAERDKNKLLLVNCQEAAERHIKLLAAVTMLEAKRDAASRSKAAQQAIIDSSLTVLEGREEIEAKVAEYNSCLERERKLAGEAALYSSGKREAESLARQAEAEQEAVDRLKAKIKQKEDELAQEQPTDQDAVIKENAVEYERQKKLLDEAYEQEREYRAVEQELTLAKYTLQQAEAQYRSDVKHLQLSEDGLKKKASLLSNIECVDISSAKCAFLTDALAARQALEEYPERYEALIEAYEGQAGPLKQQVKKLEEQMAGLSFDAGKVAFISKRLSELKPYVAQLEALNQREGKIALLKADLGHLQSNILDAEKRLSETRLRGIEAAKERDRYARAFEGHAQARSQAAVLEPWLEKEKQLPVAEERKATAMGRALELAAEIANIDAEIVAKRAEADKEKPAMAGIEELEEIAARLDAEVDAANILVREKQMELGALQQKSEQAALLKKEIAALQESQTEYAKKAADYEILKAAFCQSGVPHQIIRSIIPQLTETSNAIIGQMTGGKMGVEFRLKREQKSGKEKASLDIFIEEYGKPALPYLSKSGGEKVKSSLAVILALAEIKSSSAGIQLGFLQIDEPPFLDQDGAQAYVDALEAIQRRYSNLKVMAITHDQEFKARFPQSITVYKDECGSHVRWD